ncbi:MAG TPA: methyltransferase domain-containing protein [Gemmataceae bacterium]|nr:methyltransferase domain-containing protein [Gemmataceae bacterium]
MQLPSTQPETAKTGAAPPCRNGPPPAPVRLKLNLGCGPVQPAGWINVDDSNRAWLASHLPLLDRLLVALRLLPPTEFNRQTYYFNLKQRFPWRTGSVHAIYLGEVLEHFTREGGEYVVRECYRVLEPGGILRVRVPDMARFWSRYLEEYQRTRRLPRSEWTLEHTRWIALFFRDICVRRRPFRSMGHYHKWMYDEISLIKLLEQVGFRDVERMPYHQSRIADVAAVEAANDLIVEAVK